MPRDQYEEMYSTIEAHASDMLERIQALTDQCADLESDIDQRDEEIAELKQRIKDFEFERN